MTKKKATTTPATTTAATAPAPTTKQSSPPTTLVSLTDKLHSIRTAAMRDRADTSKLIGQLQAQREQLEEMRIDIDATIAFLRTK